MNSNRLLVVTLFLLACAAREELPPETPVVAMLDPAAPLADALAEVDARPFVPLVDTAAPRWFGNAAAGERLSARGVARFVEPLQDYASDFVPSDARLREQWALADIHATRAWDRAASAKGIVVAVVDSGVVASHPDLAGAIWTNEAEVPDNGLDDDDNGFVDDVHGWDFVDDDADPSPGANDAYSNHGTHVAGIIGAVSDNGRGISGVAPDVLVMPVRVMAGRTGRSDWIADGIDYAVANGARVINLSLGGAYSQLIDEAVARAWKAGVVVVAAAGNDGRGAVSFPASSRVTGVLGVAATDSADALASFSNFGPGVDLTAPGVDILSTYGIRSYKLLSGTSMAAPHVSGAVALRLASRGRAGTGDLSAMLASLPLGSQGVPRLDLSAMVEASARDSRKVTSRRTHLTFHAGSSRKRPPPQSISLDATAATAFSLEVPKWLHAGSCRLAPCKLALSADPSDLGYGAHAGTLLIRPSDGSEALEISVDFNVGNATGDGLAVEAEVAGQPVSTEESLSVDTGAAVVLRLIKEGRRTTAHWSIDGLAYAGSELRGTFPHEGSYKVRAVDESGQEVLLQVDARAGGASAASGVGVPHGD